MLLIEYVGHTGFRSLTEGHRGRHLEYFKTLKDARVASVGFINYNASTTRINKEENFKTKLQVILVFYQTKTYVLQKYAMLKQVNNLSIKTQQISYPTNNQDINFKMHSLFPL